MLVAEQRGTIMTIEERAEEGAALKAKGVCNCTQAVLRVFQDKTGLDEDAMTKISAGFAAGMGGLEGTCGALIGSVITAGYITEGKGTPRISKSIVSKFKELSGSTICRELKTPVNGKTLCECPQCVYNAIIALGEYLEIDS